jgi:hypothetical protein
MAANRKDNSRACASLASSNLGQILAGASSTAENPQEGKQERTFGSSSKDHAKDEMANRLSNLCDLITNLR